MRLSRRIGGPASSAARPTHCQSHNYIAYEHAQACTCAGGAACTKEDPESQLPAERAFPGLHACWVTPGVLAMARPWQELVEEKGLPAVFAAAGIRLIVNLQEARNGAGQSKTAEHS